MSPLVSTQHTATKKPPSQAITLESLDADGDIIHKDEHDDDDFMDDPKYKLSLKLVDKNKNAPLTPVLSSGATSKKLRPYALTVLDQSK